MKTKQVLAVMITSLFLLVGCSNNGDSVEESELSSKRADAKGSVIDQPYSKAQEEVLETFGAIGQIITEGAGKGYESIFMDQLISFHAYGDKFTEFNDGELYDSAGNEHNERQLFGEDIAEDGVIQFAAKEGTLKVAVYYGNVANLTFISDFILMHKEYGEIRVNNLITILFVKTQGKWKIVHEHHSPEAVEELDKASASKSKLGSKNSAISQPYSRAQEEVLETFGTIGQIITDGAGKGPNSSYMDQLISYHAYGPKFTEFNDGKLFDSAGNELNERTLFGTVVDPGGVKQFAAVPGTLKVAVYFGNVANLTFISDFKLMIGGEEYTFNNLITLLFVKVNGDWKLVHEHHSPAKLPV